MSSAFVRVLGLAVAAMLVQRLVAYIPALGWLLTTFPVTWALWIWFASRLISTGKQHLAGTENPRVAAMGWSIALGALAGFSNALFQIILGAVIMNAATTSGDAVSGLAGSLNAAVGVIALFTRPIWGMLVTGAAGLFLGGNIKSSN